MEFKLPLPVVTTLDTLKKAGYQAYIVGGAVRDLLTNKPCVDWDFTTNAPPEKIQNLFPKSFYDNKFGTVGIPVPKKAAKQKSAKKDYEIYEITTFRTESTYKDKRHPSKISWGETLKEDLKRRDFTINAMALKITNEKRKLVKDKNSNQLCQVRLTLIDPHHGQKDLGKKLIKTVGNPNKRFAEDALRMMRAIRIATELSFVIEKDTFSAISQNAHNITHISKERVRDELIKILSSNYPADGIKLLKNSSLLSYTIPELESGYGLDQKGHHIYDVFTHSLESLRHCPSKNYLVRFAALLHDIGKPQTAKGKGKNRTFYNHEVIGAHLAKDIAKRLKFKKDDVNRLFILIRWHMFSVSEFLTDSAIRRFIRRVGKENIDDIIKLRIADRLGGGCENETSWRLRRFLKRVQEVQKHTPSVHDLKISGHDVMRELNLKPGPKVGKILNALFEEILDDPKKNTKKYLLSKLKQLKDS